MLQVGNNLEMYKRCKTSYALKGQTGQRES